MNNTYTCKGKGGLYELVGVTYGAGTLRGQTFIEYREVATGVRYVREPADFQDRMELVQRATHPTALPADAQRARVRGHARDAGCKLGDDDDFWSYLYDIIARVLADETLRAPVSAGTIDTPDFREKLRHHAHCVYHARHDVDDTSMDAMIEFIGQHVAAAVAEAQARANKVIAGHMAYITELEAKLRAATAPVSAAPSNMGQDYAGPDCPREDGCDGTAGACSCTRAAPIESAKASSERGAEQPIDCRKIHGDLPVIISQDTAVHALNAMREKYNAGGYANLFADDRSFVVHGMYELEAASKAKRAAKQARKEGDAK